MPDIYIVIKAICVSDLVLEVNEKIKRGYKPLGGVCSDGGLWVQAMVKDNESTIEVEK